MTTFTALQMPESAPTHEGTASRGQNQERGARRNKQDLLSISRLADAEVDPQRPGRGWVIRIGFRAVVTGLVVNKLAGRPRSVCEIRFVIRAKRLLDLSCV